MTEDHFARLGLPRRFAVDPAELDRQYLVRSRAVHPDYHTGGASADAAASLELSAALNEAYNVLKDPFTRADYLLGLLGGPSAAEEKALDPAFLAEMMDLRERVEAVDPGVRGELAEYDRGYAADVAAAFGRVEGLPPESPDRPRVFRGIRRSLNALKTVRSLARTLPDDT